MKVSWARAVEKRVKQNGEHLWKDTYMAVARIASGSLLLKHTSLTAQYSFGCLSVFIYS
jgi:hypothetical protein